MTQNKFVKPLLLVVGLPLLYLADAAPDTPLRVTLVRDAHAIVGVPLSPISVAGVARRTTYRAVAYGGAATATTSATSQQQAATAQQQSATAQQQSATAQQQAATAQQQSGAAQKPPAPAAAAATAGAPAVGTIVKTLPAGCTQEAKGGVEYQRCGNVYYRAAFQGNSLVYVVQQP
jgi:biotin carboxyl carrier protein